MKRLGTLNLSTWAAMLLGFVGLGCALQQSERATAPELHLFQIRHRNPAQRGQTRACYAPQDKGELERGSTRAAR